MKDKVYITLGMVMVVLRFAAHAILHPLKAVPILREVAGEEAEIEAREKES